MGTEETNLSGNTESPETNAPVPAPSAEGNASSALAAQADANAENQASKNKAIDKIAKDAQTAAAAAAEEGANKASQLFDKAKKLAETALDEYSSDWADKNALALDAAALAATALSKAGLFTLPDIEIPEFELPKINEFIDKIADAYDPDAILDAAKKTLKEQQEKIEKVRDALEGERKAEEDKELQENQEQEDTWLDKLKKLGGAVEEAFDKIEGVLPEGMSIEDAVSASKDKAESLAKAAKDAANGEKVDPNTIKDLVNDLAGASGDIKDSIMKAVFSDESGKAAEAVAKADSEAKEERRGNGPCGNKTKAVGGVDFNDPEGDEEDAQQKAYYMSLFEEACASGNMSDAERYFKILTQDFGESPALLKEAMAKLTTAAPQSKAGTIRVTELLDTAKALLFAEGNDDVAKQISAEASSSDSAKEVGDGAPWVLKQSKNMAKKLLNGAKDAADMLSSVNDFVNENENAQLVLDILSK